MVTTSTHTIWGELRSALHGVDAVATKAARVRELLDRFDAGARAGAEHYVRAMMAMARARRHDAAPCDAAPSLWNDLADTMQARVDEGAVDLTRPDGALVDFEYEEGIERGEEQGWSDAQWEAFYVSFDDRDVGLIVADRVEARSPRWSDLLDAIAMADVTCWAHEVDEDGMLRRVAICQEADGFDDLLVIDLDEDRLRPLDEVFGVRVATPLIDIAPDEGAHARAWYGAWDAPTTADELRDALAIDVGPEGAMLTLDGWMRLLEHDLDVLGVANTAGTWLALLEGELDGIEALATTHSLMLYGPVRLLEQVAAHLFALGAQPDALADACASE